jgi:hypothetical protein
MPRKKKTKKKRAKREIPDWVTRRRDRIAGKTFLERTGFKIVMAEQAGLKQAQNLALFL